MYFQFWRKFGGGHAAAPAVTCAPGIFCMDTSTLGGAQFRTVPFDMDGEFREVQLRWFQDTATQDMEPHYLELFTETLGIDEALLGDQLNPATFTLDTSVLGGGSYRTVPFDMTGEFRDLQLHWYNSLSGQDMEPHYLELEFELMGVAEEQPGILL